MDATISSLASSSANLENFLNSQTLEILKSFGKYLISPAVIGVIILWGLAKILKLGEMKKIFENFQADIKDLKVKSGNIINNITVIKTHLVDKAGMNAALFKAMSPITLTPAGNKLVKSVGFQTFVSENYKELSLNFIKNKANTLLELDEISEEVVNNLFSESKLPSYDNEAFKRGISLEVLLRACALYLRNYMAKKLSITE